MRPATRGQPKLTGLLVVICLGLAAVIYLELDERPLSRTAQSMPTGGPAVAVAEREADMGFELPPLSVFSEIATRPLFSPSRRPPPAEVVAAEVAIEGPGPGEAFLLRGVALAGDSRIALMERRNTQELLRVLEGQSIDGWRLSAVRSDAVVLEGRGEEHVLEVEKDTSPPAATVERLIRRLQPADPEDPAPEEVDEPEADLGLEAEADAELELEPFDEPDLEPGG